MAIITLTTDLGRKDFYVGAVKGSILNVIPNANIIDISHEVTPFNVLEAAFILKNAYKDFPKGSIHIISIDSTQRPTNTYVCLKYDGYFFLGPDNGVLPLVLQSNYDKAYEITLAEDNAGLNSFPLKSIYSKIAGFIAQGGELEGIYKEIDELYNLVPLEPVIRDAFIQGSVIYCDNYGNLIVNINRDLFTEVGNGRPFKIHYRRMEYVSYICANYYDVPEGEVVALFGESTYLEIAVNRDRANTLLGIDVGSPIQIEFI